MPGIWGVPGCLLTRARRGADFWAAFQLLRETGLPPCEAAYGCAMQVCLQSSDAKRAQMVLELFQAAVYKRRTPAPLETVRNP